MLVRTRRIHVDAAGIRTSNGSVDRVDHLSDAHLLDHPDGRDIVLPLPDDLALPDLDRQAHRNVDGPGDCTSDRNPEADAETHGQADSRSDRHGTSDRHAFAATSRERCRPPRAPLQRRGRADLRHGWPGR